MKPHRSTAASDRAERVTRVKAKSVYTGWFLAPALIIYTLLFAVPVVMGLAYSLTNWNTMSDVVKFIGLRNFREIFALDSPYLKNLWITLVFTFFTIIIKETCGLGLALLLNGAIRSKNVLRSVFFLPQTLSPLIIGIVFISIFSPEGVVNGFLRALGLDGLARGWLADPGAVLGTTILTESWRMIGWNMVILLAGLQAIPIDYYEAASLDGASFWGQLRRITIPLLVPALTVTVVLNAIHGLKTFDLIFALTGGGPGSLTEVLNIAVFREFSMGRYGMATALGVVVFAITAIIAVLIKNAMLRNVVEA
jgi:raffinose/stachyose/melibiose transport system permease protein